MNETKPRRRRYISESGARLNVRLRPEEVTVLRSDAAARGTTVSELVRSALVAVGTPLPPRIRARQT
jgi:hypothetical protein